MEYAGSETERLQALVARLDAMAQVYQEVTGKPLYL